jgi:hypothetical protein
MWRISSRTSDRLWTEFRSAGLNHGARAYGLVPFFLQGGDVQEYA